MPWICTDPDGRFEAVAATVPACAWQVRPCDRVADFGHEKNVVPPSLEPTTQYVLGFAIIILPTVIKEGDARIQRAVDNLNCFVQTLDVPEVMAAKTQRGDLNPDLAKSSPGNLVRRRLKKFCLISVEELRVGASGPARCRS